MDSHYSFELSAEFNQFYLQDEGAEEQVDWTLQEGRDQLALKPGIIAVGTSCDRVVPVKVQVLRSEPCLNIEPWDHVVECSIAIPSGRLVIAGCFEELENASRIDLKAGSYRARIFYGNQYSCCNPTCADYYVVTLWPNDIKGVQVLKRGVDVFSSLIA